jgi:hypothetical protein
MRKRRIVVRQNMSAYVSIRQHTPTGEEDSSIRDVSSLRPRMQQYEESIESHGTIVA